MRRLWRRAPARLLSRVANRLVAAVLRSRGHRLLSGSLALLTVSHHSSGRPMTFPVMYAVDGAAVVVFVGDATGKMWWRSIDPGDRVGVRLAGRDLTGVATIYIGRRDPTGTAAVLLAWLRRFPVAAGRLGAGRIRNGEPAPRQLAALVPDAVLVRVQLPERPATPPALSTARWSAACLGGELVGIGVAAAAVTTASAPLWTWLGATAAGTVEGLAVGGLQWLALRRKLTTLPARRWIGATAALSTGGWAAGMLPSALAGDSSGATPAAWVLGLLAIAGGLCLGAAVGAVQAWAMRGHATGRRGWVAVNAAGWALGLCWIFLLAGLPTTGWPWWTVAGVGLAAGALSGLSVGMVTGLWLPRLQPAATAEVGPPVAVSYGR